MSKLAPVTERFQHFVTELKDQWWGDVYQQTRLSWQRFWVSVRERDEALGRAAYERAARPRGYRHGFYD